MADPHSNARREPKFDPNEIDELPVLTDIVDVDADFPSIAEFDDAEPAQLPVAEVSYDDEFGIDEAAAAGMQADAKVFVAPAPRSAPAGAAASRLDELRANLVAELESAATRIIAESVEEAQALLVDRVAQRLNDELAGIVGATIADFDRRRKS
ncbi:MAG TPA: hypothetical protein VFL54_11805 [Gammaproteobacteria bacterium]|jgi:hypothetical protein|nr:hypothetical protein [Gammaproteobacteria bacterium]